MTPKECDVHLRITMQKKVRSKGRESRERILRMTMQVFLKKGSYKATSTTDICRAAKVSRPTFYHHFGSKKSLLATLYMTEIEKVLKPYLDTASAIEEPLERLAYMVRTFTKDVIGRHPEMRILVHDVQVMKDRNFSEVRREWQKHYLLLRSTITELQRQGKAREDISASRAALFVLGMMTWCTFWFDFKRQEDIADVADQAAAFVLARL